MKKPPMRFWIGVMIFFTTFTNYMLRVNISVSVPAMVVSPNKNSTPYCSNFEKEEPKNNSNVSDDKFHWSESEQAWIFQGYFYGYLGLILFSGVISEWIGPLHTVVWFSFAGAVVNALAPVMARLHWGALMANRVLVGILGAPPYPAINVLIAKWAPPKEKGRFLAAMMGNTMGSVVTNILVGQISEEWGWDWGFYFLSILMLIFCVIFFFVVKDTPDQHRWISEEEKQYIAESQQGHVSKKKTFPPILKMAKSIPFWALVMAQFGNLWLLNLYIQFIPKYLKEALQFNLKNSAGISAIPHLSRLVLSFGFGFVGDYMRKKEVMRVSRIRKFFIIFSHFIASIWLISIIFVPCHKEAAISFLVLGQGFNGAVTVSHLQNPQDLAPNFAGSIYGFMNFFGMISGGIAPLIGAAIIDFHKANVPQGGAVTASPYIFTIGGAICITGGIVFIIFGSGEVQPWNEIKEDTTPPPTG